MLLFGMGSRLTGHFQKRPPFAPRVAVSRLYVGRSASLFCLLGLFSVLKLPLPSSEYGQKTRGGRAEPWDPPFRNGELWGQKKDWGGGLVGGRTRDCGLFWKAGVRAFHGAWKLHIDLGR